MKIVDAVNIGLIGSTASAVIFMFNTFASAKDVDDRVSKIELDIAYGQYYDRLDDYEEAVAEGRDKLAEEYLRQMERWKAKICEADPEWERCD